MTSSLGLLLEIIAQMLAHFRGAQAAQRLRLDLPRALAGHPENPADLLERSALAVGETIAQVDDTALALAQVIERGGQILAQELLRGEVRRGGQIIVLKEIAERMLAVLA